MLSQAPVSSALKTLPVSKLIEPSAIELGTDSTAAEQFMDVLAKLVSDTGKNADKKPQAIIDAKPAEALKAKAEAPQPEQNQDEPVKKVEVKSKSSQEEEEAAPKEEKPADAPAVASEAVATNAPVEKSVVKEEHAAQADSAQAQNQQQQNPAPQAKAPVAATPQAQAAVKVDTTNVIQQAPVAPKAAPQQAAAEVQQTLPDQQIQAQTTIDPKGVPQVAPAEIKSAPVTETDKLLLPSSPDLAELPKAAVAAPAAPAMLQSAIVASAKISDSNLAALAALQRTEVSPALQIGRAFVLEKALDEITSEKNPLLSASLMGEKAKLSNAKEAGKTGVSSQQEKIILQIQQMIDRAAQAKDGSSITVKIQPEELGEVLVRVTQRGDQLFARVVPENKEVETTVRNNVGELVAHLVTAGFKADNIHISVGRASSETSQYLTRQNGGNPSLGTGLGTGPGSGQGSGDQAGRGRHGSSNVSGSGLQPGQVAVDENKVVDSGWVA